METRLTVLPRLDSFLRNLRMTILLRQHHHQFHLFIRQEFVQGRVVLDIRIVDGAVRLGRLCTRWWGRGALHEGVQAKIGDIEDEWQVKDPGRAAVADDTDIDWCFRRHVAYGVAYAGVRL